MARGEWEERMLARVADACARLDQITGRQRNPWEQRHYHKAVGVRDGLAEALGLMIGLTGAEVVQAWRNADHAQEWGFLRSLGEEQRLKGISGTVGNGW
jgi:hypothetical protein